MEKAKHFFGLLKTIPGGQQTYRQSYELWSKQAKKTHPNLIGPEMNPEAERLWAWFLELNNARSGSGFGPNPIGYVELEAWSRLMNISLAPWEVRALRLTDAQAVATMSEKSGGS